MGKYQAYPEYKDLGVEWLGRVPVSWELAKLKNKTTRVGDGLHSTPKYGERTGFYFVNGNNLVNGKIALTSSAKEVPEDEYLKHLVKLDHKSVLLSINGTIGNVARYNSEPIILGKSAAYINCSCDLLPEFLMYYLQSGEIQRYFDLEVTGTTISNLSLNSIKQLQVCMPNESEQAQIANFLDHETAKIDTLIEKQQQLIKLLKEKRQTVISHAVTKGLNPQGPMKYSGVEWLGEVPAHWIASTLKHYSEVIDCKHITAEFFDDGIPLASISEVKKWFVDLSTAKYTSEKYYNELIGGGREPKVGDIIYSRNATVGEAAIVSEGLPPFAMGQDVCLIRLSNGLLPLFAMYVLHSGVISQQLELAMVGSTFKRINVDNIRNFAFVIPPLSEQVLIVSELEALTSKYDVLINNATNAIELMKERRTALISAAVTGKIDVRNWRQPND
ncbi:restriction endonuclease subunit S [Pseudoalteromonas sp. SMN1298-MNA-CIBAN-0114]|uniref:restriction endonuclease subunit S n=1 Tax=Pseudoalteromonas sp. SMN1298-MNA-CIBAN-0114 TaxID=3140428 RepID=UPI00331F5F38